MGTRGKQHGAPERVHLRDRVVVDGMEGLGDADLVAIVLGTGARREVGSRSMVERASSGRPVAVVASGLLDDLGGLAGLAITGAGALAGRPGVGVARGLRLAAALELGRRVARATKQGPARLVPESRAVFAWAEPRVAALDHEELWALALDGRHRLRSARRVAMGGLSGLHVAPRDALRAMLREGAHAFVLVHNHPSGDPTPSREDVEFTARLASAAHLVGVPLLDHVVVARTTYVSMLDTGLFDASYVGALGETFGVSLEPPAGKPPADTSRKRRARFEDARFEGPRSEGRPTRAKGRPTEAGLARAAEG